MDVVGSLAYTGQDLLFIDPERFVFVAGRSVCVYDITKGPREMLWRSEYGVNCCAVNHESQLIVLAPATVGLDLELLQLPDLNSLRFIANPTKTILIDVSFNRLGDRLYALSDRDEHTAMIWSINGLPSLLLRLPLSSFFTRCLVNPCEPNQFVLLGEDDLQVANVSDLLGSLSAKLDALPLDRSGSDEEDTLMKHFSVLFVLWLPLNRILVGGSSGQFTIDEALLPTNEPSATLTATRAVLSVSHLIIATAVGNLFWYPIIDIMNKGLGTSVFDFTRAQQVSTMSGAVSSLCIDQHFTTLAIGCAGGEILKVPVDISDSSIHNFDDLNKLENENDVQVSNTIETVLPELISVEHQEGVTLVSRNLCLSVEKIAGIRAPKSTLTMFVTASHNGQLKFWRQLSLVVEPLQVGGGIRRSIPRPLKTVFELSISGLQSSSDHQAPAVCILEFYLLPNRPSCSLILIGTELGFLEVWILEAVEYDDEDMRESGEVNGVKFTEDDEGSCAVKLETRKLYEARLFETPLAFVTFFSSRNSDGIESHNATLGSSGDNRIYFVNLLKGDQIVLNNLPNYIAVDSGDTACSCVVRKSILYYFCTSGNILAFDASNIDKIQDKHQFYSGIGDIGFAAIAPGNSNVVVLSNSSLVYLFQLKALNLEKGSVSDNAGFRSIEHRDIVVSVAHSPSGRYFATGCIDGSVFLWRSEDDEVTLANQMHPHSASILAMIFSSDSSLLMTSSIDGCTFIFTVDKPSLLNHQRLAQPNFLHDTSLQVRLSEIPTKLLSATDPTQNQLTWLARKEADQVKDKKAQFKFKSMGISAAVGEIAQRLQVLLEQNLTRSPLEQLDRTEFVIDLKRKADIVDDNSSCVDALRSSYQQKNCLNEMRAARLRAKFWDTMEVNSTRLLPFYDSVAQRGYDIEVSSFAIQKKSPDQIQFLAKVKRLRGMELRSQRYSTLGTVSRVPNVFTGGRNGPYRCCWSTAVKGSPSVIQWILDDGTRWPSSDVIELLLLNDSGGQPGAVSNVVEDGRDKDKNAAISAVATHSYDDIDDETSINDGGGVEREIDENNVLNLLYPPQAVRTQVQQKSQIIFLKEVIRLIKGQFNEKFSNLLRDKEDIISLIELRNSRLREILADLHQHDEEVEQPRLANIEVPGSSIEVEENELSTKPYESDSARQVRLKEEEERRRREAETDKEDVRGRALNDMMHGTLEVKRDVFAEAEALGRPEWMDQLTPAEMNEGQQKEYEAYQQKVKVLQEEQVNYKKLLEQEMKKIRHEITELCKSFDDKLEDIAKLKILAQREIVSQELYISRMSTTMAKIDQSWKVLKKTEEQIQGLRRDRNEMRTKLNKYIQSFDAMKMRLGSLQEEERQLDKSFRRDLQNLCNDNFDQDSLKVFTQLYRLRTYPRGGGNSNGDSLENYADQSNSMGVSASASQSNTRRKDGSKKHSRSQSKKGHNSSMKSTQKNKLKASKGVSAGGTGGSLGPMQQAAQALRSSEETSKSYKDKDPYYLALLKQEKQKKVYEAQIPILVPISIELDCPEGFEVDQFTWSKLQELRNARIEKEIEARSLAIEVNDFKQKLDLLEGEEAVLGACTADLVKSREELLKSLANLNSNLDMVVCLRQGQDEVDKDAVITDYGDAMLIPSEILGNYNSRIKELGKEKIGVLSKIKQFRRRINLIDWEAKHFGLESRHYEAYLTDLQLFRVTRELQKIIRDGSDADQAKVRLDKVAVRKEFLVKDAETKLANLRRMNETLARQLEDRDHECVQLEGRITNLRTQVTSSHSIKQSRDEARGVLGDPINIAAQKMRKVVSRRQMVDTARAQAEEIDFLRQELDKMRQRTFPSFIRATRKRLSTNPGEY